MQHEVPQFIDVEDRIVGPFTFPQFIYLFGGGGIAYLIFKVLGGITGFMLAVLVFGFGFLLAFFKYNGRSFSQLLQSIINYFMRGRLFLWQKQRVIVIDKKTVVYETEKKVSKPKRNIHEISKGLDISDNL